MFGVFGWSSPIYDKVSTKRSVYYGANSTMTGSSARFNFDQTAELLKWYNAGQRGIQFLYFEDALLLKSVLYKENDIFRKKEKVSRKFGYKLNAQVKCLMKVWTWQLAASSTSPGF